MDAVRDLFDALNISVCVEDHRHAGRPIQAAFVGGLRPEQEKAVKALMAHETGVLAATTAFGKTIVGAHMIAARGVNTLVLVHRRQLMDQWVERLGAFLNVGRENIGTIGGGKRKAKGVIDVALIQSLARKGEVDDLVGDYGHLIIDECHHLSAVSFELVARRAKAKYVLGLSATPTRKDGHHPIIFMQCGPIRHRVDAKSEAGKRPFSHLVRFRNTGFRPPASDPEARLQIQDLYRALVAGGARNETIIADVRSAIAANRSPVVITERTDHLAALAARLAGHVRHVITLRGGQSEKQRRALAERMAAIGDDEERVIVATGRYLGEGFDDPRLDTLFLTMPISSPANET